MDNLRIATGDISGMAYVWNLSNVLNPAMGSGQRLEDSITNVLVFHKWDIQNLNLNLNFPALNDNTFKFPSLCSQSA